MSAVLLALVCLELVEGVLEVVLSEAVHDSLSRSWRMNSGQKLSMFEGLGCWLMLVVDL